MKKYIILCATALLAMMFASCSNEEITIATTYTFNVNASGVVSSFIEAKSGELEAFDSSNEKLRIRLLVYNDKGELAAQESSLFTNYNTQLKTAKFLATGTYTVVGISDVVYVNGNSIETEFWKLSGESKLSEMKITDQGLVGNEARILGIAKYSLTISDNNPGSLNVDLRPAGALIYSFVWNAGYFSSIDIASYWLCANKSSEALSFDNAGNYVITERQESDIFYKLVGVDAEDGNWYWYNYVLPMNNLHIYYNAFYKDGSYVSILDGTTINLKAGDEYVGHLDLYYFGEYYKPVTGSSSFDFPGKASVPAMKAPFASKKVDKTAPMPKEIFNQLNHVLRASDIK